MLGINTDHLFSLSESRVFAVSFSLLAATGKSPSHHLVQHNWNIMTRLHLLPHPLK